MGTKGFIQEDLSEAEVPRQSLEIDVNDEFERRMAKVARAAAEAVYNRTPLPPNHGRIHFNGSTKIVLWWLGAATTVLTGLMLLVLQAVYNTNGSVSEVKGQQESTQAEVTEMRREMSAFQAELMAVSQRQSNGR